jgi:hypothetical protein
MDEETTKTQILNVVFTGCLIEFIDWRYSQYNVGIFDPSCELLPFYLLSESDLPHPSPLSKVNVHYIQTVCGCGGVSSCVVDHRYSAEV